MPSNKTYQAKCDDCSYSGTRHQTQAEAESDATKHVSKPANANHSVSIITREEKSSPFKLKKK